MSIILQVEDYLWDVCFVDIHKFNLMEAIFFTWDTWFLLTNDNGTAF